MSPDLAFMLMLALRMAVAAAFVVTASFIAERSGPVIGALVATLPISAGPSYVFLALDHNAAFIAEGALASLPINAATIFLGLTYVVLAQRRNVAVSAGGAIVVWLRWPRWRAWCHGRYQRPDRECRGVCDLPAAAAALSPRPDAADHAPLVRNSAARRTGRDIGGTVVSLSGWVGPVVSGTIALFPVVFTSIMLILHPRVGGPATAAVIANGGWGLMGFSLGIAVLHLAGCSLAPRSG